MPALIPLLLSVAPTVAEWLLGDKTGTAVAKVTDIAKQVLGVDSPDAIERAIATDPNLALQFKMQIIQAASDARRADLDELKAQLADVQSARAQTTALAQVHSPIAYGAVVVSILVLAAFGLGLYGIVKQEVPAGSRDLANILLGTLATMAVSVVSYWVGSSAGSAQKNHLVESLVKNPPS